MNNRRYFFFLGLLLLCVTTTLPARGRKEKSSNEDRPVVQVTGVVRLVGSSLFPELVITGAESQWHIIKEEMNKLYDQQHRTVTVEGEESITELTFVNGLSAGIRRELRNIRIISIQ